MGQIHLEGYLCLDESPILETYIIHLHSIPTLTPRRQCCRCQEAVAAGKGDHLEAREDPVKFSSNFEQLVSIVNLQTAFFFCFISYSW